MIFYRIEKKEICEKVGFRRGVFSGDYHYSGKMAWDAHIFYSDGYQGPWYPNPQTMPLPTEDDGMDRWSNMRWWTKEKYLFGFPTLNHIRKWFGHSGGRRELDEAGFQISIYKAPKKKMVVGENQVAADRRHMELIKTLSLTEI